MHATIRRLAAQSFKAQTAAPSASSGGGLMQMLFDAPSQLPLNEEVAGLPALHGKGPAPAAPQTTRLANGLTVTSEDRHGSTSSVGIYAKAGSRYDTLPGVSSALQHLAFGSTQSRSSIKLARDLEDAGASVAAMSGREIFAYTGESLREGAGTMAEALCEAVTEPKLVSWEVTEQLHELEALVALRARDPATVVAEGLHAAAFGGASALGHSLLASPAQLHAIDADALRAFLGGRLAGANVVVSATNVDHKALVALAESALGSLPPGSAAAPARPAIVGGEVLVRGADAGHGAGAAYVALGLPAPAQGSAQFPALTVLEALLGAAGSRGLPGHPRLGYARQSRLAAGAKSGALAVLRNSSAFAYSYSDTGLLGVSGACAEHEAGLFVAAVVGLLKDLAAKPAQAPELERAKRACKFALLAQAESRQGARDEAGTAPLLGRRVGVAEALRAIDSVTADQVAAVARAALQGPHSLSASGGALSSLPRYDVLAAMLK